MVGSAPFILDDGCDVVFDVYAGVAGVASCAYDACVVDAAFPAGVGVVVALVDAVALAVAVVVAPGVACIAISVCVVVVGVATIS